MNYLIYLIAFSFLISSCKKKEEFNNSQTEKFVNKTNLQVSFATYNYVKSDDVFIKNDSVVLLPDNSHSYSTNSFGTKLFSCNDAIVRFNSVSLFDSLVLTFGDGKKLSLNNFDTLSLRNQENYLCNQLDERSVLFVYEIDSADYNLAQ
ncbi:MAG: hypothetical protein AB8B61_07565 [Cyclobacteriaceae bacterium]